MARHRKPKPPVDWDKGKRWAQAVTHWVELLAALIALTLFLIGKA